MAELRNYQTRAVNAGSRADASIDEGLRAYMLKVYNLMALGLAITGVAALGTMMLATTNDPATAVATLGNGKMLTSLGVALYGSPLKWVVMLAPLGMVFFLSARVHTMSVSGAQTAFWVFAALMGLSLSSIFLVYTAQSITQTFFITAASFGALSLWGYTTKRDLTGMGTFLFMGVIGLIIAMVVNIFLASPALQFAISAIGVPCSRASPPTTRRRSRRCTTRATKFWSLAARPSSARSTLTSTPSTCSPSCCRSWATANNGYQPGGWTGKERRAAQAAALFFGVRAVMRPEHRGEYSERTDYKAGDGVRSRCDHRNLCGCGDRTARQATNSSRRPGPRWRCASKHSSPAAFPIWPRKARAVCSALRLCRAVPPSAGLSLRRRRHRARLLSGSPEVTNYDDIEGDSGHALVVDIDEQDPRRPVTVDAERVGRWRFVTLSRSVDDSRDITDLDLNLDLMPDKDRTVVRLGLTGSLTVTDKAKLDACLDRYARVFAALSVWERGTDIAVLPADGEFDDLGIGGFAAAAVDELVELARADGDDADDARAALALLLRLVDRGDAA